MGQPLQDPAKEKKGAGPYSFLLTFSLTLVPLLAETGSPRTKKNCNLQDSHKFIEAFSDDSDGQESSCNAGDPGLIHGSGRSPEEGNGSPLPCSCREKSRDRGVQRYSPCGCKE